MGSNRSSSGFEPGDDELTNTQVEVLGLFRRVVRIVASDPTIGIQNLQEFHVIIRRLWEEAPETAEALATTIQEARSSGDDSVQQEQDAVRKSTSHPAKSKRVSGKDLSYRPPKSAKAKPTDSSSSALPENSEIQADVSVEDSTARGTQSLVLNADAIVLQNQNTGVGLEASQQYIARNDFVPTDVDATDRQETATEAIKDTKESIETTTEATSGCNRVDNTQATVLPRPPTPLANIDPAVVTPTKLIEGAPTSPQTEEIHRKTMSTSLESFSSSPVSRSVLSSPETISLIDLVTEAVRVIHQFSKYPQAVPAGVHSRILQTYRSNSQKAIDGLNLDHGWSDGSAWMRILEMGSTQNQRVTILNMIEYLGAWGWYEKQVNLATTTIRTKKGKLVDRKGAATHVLNTMPSMQREAAPRGRWIGGVGRVAVEQEGDTADLDPESGDAGITAKDRQLRRKRISMQLSRGQKLGTKLVKELGLGILFSPKIWEYTKMHGEQLDGLIGNIQADPRRMQLLRILGPQLEQLVCEGQPDLHTLYNALCQEKLVSPKELQDLRVTFALDSDPMPKGALDIAVHSLTRDVSTRVLGKRKFEDVDAVAVNEMPVSCDIFDRLRHGQWLNDDIINLAINISDQPDFVRHGYSVPLDNVGKTRTTRPIQRPLAAWGRRINRLREKARTASGDMIPLVYFCPLNHRGDHFTLLEINDQEKVIRHYDSMADQATIDGSLKLTRVARLVDEEFAGLKYTYSEAPTPQQTEGWSCGIRVVWNFRRLSNGLPIGGWDAVQDPERMKLELVEGLRACIETNAMSKYMDEVHEPSSDLEEILGNKLKSARRRCP